MRTTIRHSAVLGAVLAAWVLFPAWSWARVNSLTAGLTTSFDYTERTYDDIEDDPETEIDESALTDDEGDYRRMSVVPLLLFRSTSERDAFEISLAPELQYDFLDSDTDWAGTVAVAADRFITRNWQLGIENTFIRGDDYLTDEEALLEPTEEAEEPAPGTAAPELSPDIDRSRYWRNTLDVFSEHRYREDSMFRIGASYVVLRNDDDGLTDVEDYDRYEGLFINEHRFSAIWSTTVDLRLVRGIFDEPAPTVVAVLEELLPEEDVAAAEEALSDDLWEYRGLFAITNESIERNPLELRYWYIGTRYDEDLRRGVDIHQSRFTWRRDYSPSLYTSLGVGATFLDLEEQDDEWDVNGLAEINYLIERGSFNASLEKGFDSLDFGGTTDRGLVDYWQARLAMSYDLTQNLTMTAQFSYLYEDRSEPLLLDLIEALSEETSTELSEYHNDRYLAGVGFSYTFWNFYTAGIDYTYVTQDSDRVADSYDEHRLMLTLAWRMEIMRW